MHQYRREFLLYASSQQPLQDMEQRCLLLELRELELVQATVGMLLHSVRSKLQRISRWTQTKRGESLQVVVLNHQMLGIPNQNVVEVENQLES